MTALAGRLGVTLPFDDVSLQDHRPLLRSLVGAGYHDVWTGEVAANDGFGPLALWAGWEDELSVSCAVTSVFTRGPGVLAMTAATLGEIAPGRARFGIGAGSDVIVSKWNGVPFERPFQKVADSLDFLREVLAGERATDRATVHAAGFRLLRPVPDPPKLVVAALGPRMQELAASRADGVVLNFLSAADTKLVADRCQEVPRQVDGDLEISCRIFVIPGEGDHVEQAARRHLAGYLTVPVYAAFQRWLGRGPALEEMARRWGDGDRKEATAAIPADVVTDLVVYGSPEHCAEGVQRYLDAGVDAVTLYLLPNPQPLSPPERVEFLASIARHLRP